MFTIIIPTYKRKDGLLRAIRSVLTQDYQDWKMIIINDSPDDRSYNTPMQEVGDSRVTYLVNPENRGANYARNRGLDAASNEASWIVFLDDDDYLAPDALTTLAALIEAHPDHSWFMTNRATADGTSLTIAPADDATYAYAYNYLITKKIKGDATHCIQKKMVTGVYFPQTIKQGDEWLFFYELSLRTPLFYYNVNTTLTDGYAAEGLNYRPRPFREQLRTVRCLYAEGIARKLHTKPAFITYLLMRVVRACIKH